MEHARRLYGRPAGGSARALAAHVGVVLTARVPPCMPTTDELNDWMRAVAGAADRRAFAALFRHYAPKVKGFLVRSGTPESVAEEIAQETMVALWRRASSFDPERARLSTWLFTIARNLVIDQYRRQGAGAASVPIDEWHADALPDDPQRAPEELVLTAEREHRVRDAMRALPDDQARVLRMSFFGEHPHARIAEELGIPLGTVKSRIRLAVAHLRRLLDGYES